MFAILRFFADRYQRPLWLTEFDCERSVSWAARSSHVNPQRRKHSNALPGAGDQETQQTQIDLINKCEQCQHSQHCPYPPPLIYVI
jgi:hypothetical protein